MGEINIKRNVINIIIFVLVFVASALIVNGTEANISENTIYIVKNLSEYEKNIEDMRNVVEGLRAQVDSEKNFLTEHENNNFLDDIIDINKQIEELRFYNGFTDVRGPGIMMRVSDSVIDDESIDIMEKIIHDVDITVLLNDLKSAGAEAIDVNGKRIINISEVVCAGPVLQINGEAVPAPFVIRAIGDQEENTYAYDLKNKYGMEVVVVMSYNMVVPKYYGSNYEAEYAISDKR